MDFNIGFVKSHFMGHKKNSGDLAKFLSYALGRHPEEFGLIPDSEGYVKIKDLLKALSEEDGWKYVRRSHLNEIILTQPAPSVEIQENRIRAADRTRLATGQNDPGEDLPKHLFTCIRRKAHLYVLENGISPAGHPHVILSSDEDMAQRLGKRADASPVLITVQTAKCREQGINIIRAGDYSLFHADFIPVDCFIAPPLPKQRAETKKAADAKKQEKPAKEEKFFTPGSFFPDFSEEDEKKYIQKQRKKDQISRDKEKRNARRVKWDGRK